MSSVLTRNVFNLDLISGNTFDGVFIEGDGAAGNVVQGSLIGTDVTGLLDLGNRDAGVDICFAGAANVVVGTAAGAANVISGNDEDGVTVEGSDGNFVRGNLIGTDVTGTAALGNSVNGVNMIDASGTRSAVRPPRHGTSSRATVTTASRSADRGCGISSRATLSA